MAKLKIKKGDQVIVRTGKDKGRKGAVIDVRPVEGRVKVQGINMVTRHRRPTQANAGGIEQMEAPIHISNVALIDPETNQATLEPALTSLMAIKFELPASRAR